MGGPAQGNGRPGRNASALEKMLSFAGKRQNQARNFSKVAPSTQHREDRIVGEYKAWVKEVKTELQEIDSNITSTELDAYCFPPSDNGSFNNLYKLLTSFLDYTASNLTPGSSSDKKTSFRSLKSYTDTLSKKIREIYEAKARNTGIHDIPAREELKTELVNTGSFLVRDYDFETMPAPKIVPLGRAEINCPLELDTRIEADDSVDDFEDDSVQSNHFKTARTFRRLTDSNTLPDRELVASQTDPCTRSTTITPEIMEISESDELPGACVDKELAGDISRGEIVIEDSEEERLEAASSTHVLTRTAQGVGTRGNSSKNSSPGRQPLRLPGTRLAKIVGLSHGQRGRSSDDAPAPPPLITDKPQPNVVANITSVLRPKPSSKSLSKVAPKAAPKHSSKPLAKAASKGSSNAPAEATSESSFKPHKSDDGRNRNLHDFFKPTQSLAVSDALPEVSEHLGTENDSDEDVRPAKRLRRNVSL